MGAWSYSLIQGLKGIQDSFSGFLRFEAMVGSVITRIRAALRDGKRVSVSLADARAEGQGLKLLVGTEKVWKGTARLAGTARKSPADAQKLNPGACRSSPPPTHLTAREIQILRLVARGLHNRQIADRIHRSIKTVEKHRQNLNTKLSTHEVAGLTRHALAMGLLGKPRQLSRILGKRAKHLTPREMEVLKLVAQGSGNKWIAGELHRSIKTVDHHRENIMKKLGVHEVAGLTRYAVFLGLM